MIRAVLVLLILLPLAADDNKADVAEFQKAYSLAADEDVKRIPSPRPKTADAWIGKNAPHMARQLGEVTAMTFRWSDPDQLKQWSAHFGSDTGWPLRSIPRYLEMDLHEFEIEGNAELLKTGITGDWVYRGNATVERKASALEAILRKVVDPKIVVEFRLVERDVIVVRGKYRYTPIGERINNQVEIYGKEIVAGGGGHGGGGGTFPDFLKWVGDWIETPVVSEEVEAAPGMLSWSYNGRNPSTPAQQREDHDETMVLKHLAEQTGLTYTLERREIKVLFVEKEKPVP